jgi:hypothetical protein
LRDASPEELRDRPHQDRIGVFRSGGARPPTQVVVDYIRAHKDRFGVEPICRVLTEHGVTIAPSTYYLRVTCPVSAAELADAYAANALVDLYRLHRRLYGARKLWLRMTSPSGPTVMA